MSHVTSDAFAVKTCTKCNEPKPITDFYRFTTGRNAGKYHAQCRACLAAARRKSYAADPRAQEKQRLKTRTYRDADRGKYLERSRVHSASNRESKRASAAKAKVANRERTRAHDAVARAIRRGLLPPVWSMVCEDCREAQAANYHHHKGYAKEFRLDVVALCTGCHGKAHWVD